MASRHCLPRCPTLPDCDDSAGSVVLASTAVTHTLCLALAPLASSTRPDDVRNTQASAAADDVDGGVSYEDPDELHGFWEAVNSEIDQINPGACCGGRMWLSRA